MLLMGSNRYPYPRFVSSFDGKIYVSRALEVKDLFNRNAIISSHDAAQC